MKKFKIFFIVYLFVGSLILGFASTSVMGVVGLDAYQYYDEDWLTGGLVMSKDNTYYAYANSDEQRIYIRNVSDNGLVKYLGGSDTPKAMVFSGSDDEVLYLEIGASGLAKYDIGTDSWAYEIETFGACDRGYEISYNDEWIVGQHSGTMRFADLEPIAVDEGDYDGHSPSLSPNSYNMCYLELTAGTIYLNLTRIDTRVDYDSIDISTVQSCTTYMFNDGMYATDFTDDYVYVSFYDSTDLDKYVYRFDKDDLDTYELVLNNTQLNNIGNGIDVSDDDEYIVVGYHNSADSMEMFDVDTGSLVDTGGTYANKVRWSNDHSFFMMEDNSNNDDIYIYSTDYSIDEGAGQSEGSDPADTYSSYCTDEPFNERIVILNNYLEDFVASWGDVEINAVDFFVRDEQYNINNDASDYVLYVNDVLQGGADYFFQETSQMYVLRWIDIDLDVGTNNVVLEIANTNLDGEWYFFADNNGDSAKAHNTLGNFGNGVTNGNDIDCTLATCIYYTETVQESTNDFTITKNYDGDLQLNDTGEFIIAKTNPSLSAHWEVRNATGVLCDDGNFTTPMFWALYFADHNYGTGSYYIRVKRTLFMDWDDPEVANLSFTVSGEVTYGCTDWDIKLSDSTPELFDFVDIEYLVPYEESGAWLKLYNPLYPEDSDILIVTGLSNTSCNYEILEHYAWLLYTGIWKLEIYNSTNELKASRTYQVGSDFVYSLLVDDTVYKDAFQGDTVTFTGTNSDQVNYVGIKVYNIANSSDYFYIDISGESSFTKNWFLTTIGTYRARIVIGQDKTELDDGYYVTVVVNEPITGGGEDTDPFGDSWYGVPYWVPYFIGIFVTLFVTFSPLMIATYITRKTRIDRINIPSFVYVGFFFFGLTINVMIGFLPIWLPFIILFAMVLYFAVQWLYGKKGAIEGE